MKKICVVILNAYLALCLAQCKQSTSSSSPAKKPSVANSQSSSGTPADYTSQITQAAQNLLTSSDCTGGNTNAVCANAQAIVSNPDAVSSAIQTITQDPSGLSTINDAVTTTMQNSNAPTPANSSSSDINNPTNTDNSTDSGITTSVQTASQSKSSSLSGGAIAGITIGAAIGAFIVGGGVYYKFFRDTSSSVKRISAADQSTQDSARQAKRRISQLTPSSNLSPQGRVNELREKVSAASSSSDPQKIIDQGADASGRANSSAKSVELGQLTGNLSPSPRSPSHPLPLPPLYPDLDTLDRVADRLEAAIGVVAHSPNPTPAQFQAVASATQSVDKTVIEIQRERYKKVFSNLSFKFEQPGYRPNIEHIWGMLTPIGGLLKKTSLSPAELENIEKFISLLELCERDVNFLNSQFVENIRAISANPSTTHPSIVIPQESGISLHPQSVAASHANPQPILEHASHPTPQPANLEAGKESVSFAHNFPLDPPVVHQAPHGGTVTPHGTVPHGTVPHGRVIRIHLVDDNSPTQTYLNILGSVLNDIANTPH